MSDLPKLHIAVLMGGWANERPVSLMSGEGVAKALEALGHRVTRIDMDRQVAARIAEAAPDVVFNALHGVPGEDGTVQSSVRKVDPQEDEAETGTETATAQVTDGG